MGLAGGVADGLWGGTEGLSPGGGLSVGGGLSPTPGGGITYLTDDAGLNLLTNDAGSFDLTRS